MKLKCCLVAELHCSVLLLVVDGGHRAVIFDRFQGVKKITVGEGTHFLIPWVQRPIIFDIRSTARSVPTITGSKGIQFLCLCLQILATMYFCILDLMHSCISLLLSHDFIDYQVETITD